MQVFQFNEIVPEELKKYNENAFVFNVSIDELKKIQVVENKFVTEDLGSSCESVDIFVDTMDEGLKIIDTYLNKHSFFAAEGDSESGIYTVGGMIELLESKGVQFKGILVVVRTMSNFMLDSKDVNSYSSYYNICLAEVSILLEDNPALGGLLAKQKVRLSSNYREEVILLLNELHKSNKISIYSYDTFRKLFS
jgi:hypothetical protein